MECRYTRSPPVKIEPPPRGRGLMGLRALYSVWLMISLASSAWGADPIPNPGPEAKVLVLTPVLELDQEETGPAVIDGQQASPGEYPVSFLLKTDQGKCTWFLIGARTLMTAAHCVSHGASIRIEKKKDQTGAYEGKCERAPGYSSDPSQDWALCLLAENYPPPVLYGKPLTGYEVLNTDPAAVKKKKRIQITGFGCDYERGPLDGIYRVGWAEIFEVPPWASLPDVVGRTPNVLMIEKQPSQLCGGDSGGPAFFEPVEGFRQVIGINSETVYADGYGYLASTSTEDALDFFNRWAKTHGQKICGLHEDVEDCRPIKP
jgi:hypothetical protein